MAVAAITTPRLSSDGWSRPPGARPADDAANHGRRPSWTHSPARCRACDARVELHAIAAGGDGRCPNCATPFSEAWTLLLIEECGAVENLVAALVRSLRRLCGLPGNLELQPDELLANLTAEVPWRLSIDTEPAKVTAQIGELTRRLDDNADPPPTGLTRDIRSLARSLLGLATVLEANQEAVEPTHIGAGDAARDAARDLSRAADWLDAGAADLAGVRQGLRAAADAT
jgi:hypothetical protein